MKAITVVKEKAVEFERKVTSAARPIFVRPPAEYQKSTSVTSSGPKLWLRARKAISSAGAAFLGVGLVGIAVFGYEIFKSGGLSSLVGMADGVGLILSIVVLIAGMFMK